MLEWTVEVTRFYNDAANAILKALSAQLVPHCIQLIVKETPASPGYAEARMLT